MCLIKLDLTSDLKITVDIVSIIVHQRTDNYCWSHKNITKQHTAAPLIPCAVCGGSARYILSSKVKLINNIKKKKYLFKLV